MEHKTLADLTAAGAILPDSVVASILANFSAEDKLMMGFKPKSFDGEKISEGWGGDITTATALNPCTEIMLDESSPIPDVWWSEKKTYSLKTYSFDIESYDAPYYSLEMAKWSGNKFKMHAEMYGGPAAHAWGKEVAIKRAEEQQKLAALCDLPPAEPARFRPFTSRDHSSLRSMKQAMFDRIVEGTRRQRTPAVVGFQSGSYGPAYRNRAGTMCAIGLLIDPSVSVSEGKMANDPEVIRAIGTNEMMSDFLMSAQRRLHDAISTATNFMEAFERAAESFASDHGLAMVPA